MFVFFQDKEDEAAVSFPRDVWVPKQLDRSRWYMNPFVEGAGGEGDSSVDPPTSKTVMDETVSSLFAVVCLFVCLLLLTLSACAEGYSTQLVCHSFIHSFCLSVTGNAASEDNRWLRIQSQR